MNSSTKLWLILGELLICRLFSANGQANLAVRHVSKDVRDVLKQEPKMYDTRSPVFS